MIPSRFYIGLMGFFLAALVFGVLYFLISMGESSYVVNNGISHGLRYFDKPRYDMNMQGLIFALTFLAAGILLLLLMILPGQEPALMRSMEPPQPRKRPPGAPQPQSAPQQQAAPQSQTVGDASPVTVEIEQDSGASEKVSESPSDRAAKKVTSVDDEISINEEAVDMDDIPDTRGEMSGDEDVVYGNGRVTDDSVWEFIHDHPDSAVKFLYRKTLENKPLSPNEEDIYRRWDMRGMTRTKVRKLMLELMGWKSLPDDFPHNIWKSLRDQIYDIKTKMPS